MEAVLYDKKNPLEIELENGKIYKALKKHSREDFIEHVTRKVEEKYLEVLDLRVAEEREFDKETLEIIAESERNIGKVIKYIPYRQDDYIYVVITSVEVDPRVNRVYYVVRGLSDNKRYAPSVSNKTIEVDEKKTKLRNG